MRSFKNLSALMLALAVLSGCSALNHFGEFREGMDAGPRPDAGRDAFALPDAGAPDAPAEDAPAAEDAPLDAHAEDAPAAHDAPLAHDATSGSDANADAP